MNTRLGARTIVLIFADIAIIFGGILLALVLHLGFQGASLELSENFGWWKISVAAVVFLINLYFLDLYDNTVVSDRRELNLRLMQAIGFTWAFLAILFYLFPAFLIGRGTAVYSVAISLVALIAFRNAIHFIFGHPDLGEKILIVGDRQVIANTVKAARRRRDAGHRIIGFVADERAERSAILGVCHLGTIGDLEKIVEQEKVDRIVIGVHDQRGTFPAEPLLRLRLAGSSIIEESTSFFERVTGSVHLDYLRPSWLIFSMRPRDSRLKTVIREGLYRGIALIGLILALPIALVTVLCIKLESRGSCFYRQKRVGKNGRIFELIKFRSMRHDAEEDGGPVWAAPDDDRATRVGRVIRKIRIDEIPQFWNILRGEMSFIGPRPERPYFVSQLAEKIPFYDHRHLVPPGLTGWAQINYPYGANVEDARQKLQYDLYYIKNQTLGLDLIIMFETIKTILFGRGAR
ncbi:MAG: TIGR03013 family XrtA/PEP-CTERM system glycosyltransferase [Pyrinomonadaceae bacterium]